MTWLDLFFYCLYSSMVAVVVVGVYLMMRSRPKR